MKSLIKFYTVEEKTVHTAYDLKVKKKQKLMMSMETVLLLRLKILVFIL